MTAGASRIAWHGGEHVFCLAACGTVMSLEDCRKASLATIYTRLADGRWYAADVRETVRLGLIGGGLSDREAAHLVRRSVDRHPGGLMSSVALAIGVIEPAISGVVDDTPDTAGEGKGGAAFQHADGRMRRSAILGLGGALGWSTAQTYAASVWEIAAMIRGHNLANGASELPEPPSNDEFDAMLERFKIQVH